MNARIKLNEHALWWFVIAGIFFGLLTSSWTVFIIVTLGLMGSALYSGGIRLNPQPRRPRRR